MHSATNHAHLRSSSPGAAYGGPLVWLGGSCSVSLKYSAGSLKYSAVLFAPMRDFSCGIAFRICTCGAVPAGIGSVTEELGVFGGVGGGVPILDPLGQRVAEEHKEAIPS